MESCSVPATIVLNDCMSRIRSMHVNMTHDCTILIGKSKRKKSNQVHDSECMALSETEYDVGD